MEQRFETEQREEARKDAMLKEKLQDAKAVAEREQQAALEREKELAIARVKQRALQAIAKQRQHMQAEEDLAHERKVEVLKEKVSAKQYADQSIDAPVYSCPVLKQGIDYWKSSPGIPGRYRRGLTYGNREYRSKFVNVDGKGRRFSNLTACAEAGDAYVVSYKQQNRVLETLAPAATAL